MAHEHRAQLRRAIGLATPQQGDPVCARDTGPDALHDDAGGVLSDAGDDARASVVASFRYLRLIAFGHQDVAIGQHVRPAGMVKVSGQSLDVEPSGRSEEHTSELQSLMRISYAVFCLKKKKQK